MSGAEIELLHLQFAACEWDEHRHNAHIGDVTVLSYMPEAMLVRVIDAPWTLPDADLPTLPQSFDKTGVFVLKPISNTFNVLSADKTKLTVQRLMLPLVPASVCIVYGAQAEGWPAVVADLERPPHMSPETHWLANYVILSRAFDIDGLLLLRNTTRASLEAGAPQYLLDEINRLLQLERQSTALVSQELEKIPHLPVEIKNMFLPNSAETQKQLHAELMAQKVTVPIDADQTKTKLQHAPPPIHRTSSAKRSRYKQPAFPRIASRDPPNPPPLKRNRMQGASDASNVFRTVVPSSETDHITSQTHALRSAASNISTPSVTLPVSPKSHSSLTSPSDPPLVAAVVPDPLRIPAEELPSLDSLAPMEPQITSEYLPLEPMMRIHKILGYARSDDQYPCNANIGLNNLGNTCYVNSLLQALSALSLVQQWTRHTHYVAFRAS